MERISPSEIKYHYYLTSQEPSDQFISSMEPGLSGLLDTEMRPRSDVHHIG